MTTNATFENESKSDKFRKRKTSIGVLAFEPMKRNEKNVIK